MYAIGALRQALSDLWEESLFIIVSGLLGGLFSILVLTIPLVFAAHYNAALRISERRVVSIRDWFRLSRENLRFFVAWALLAILIAVMLAGNVLFYMQLNVEWARLLAWAMGGLLITWVLPQPFVPAFYLQQTDRRLRTALRNTAVLMVTDPLSIVVLWVSAAVLAVPIGYFAWPLLPALMPFIALVSTRIVKGYAQSEA